MNILPLFPTAIGKVYKFITEKERLELMASIEKISHTSHGAIKGDGFSTHTKPNLCVDKSIIQRLQDAGEVYSQEYGNGPIILVDMWSNIQNIGSILTEHCHPTSIISGALYINVDETCKLYFHNPNPYVHFIASKTSTSFNYQNQWIPVKNCQMILFPSWLKHGNNREVNTMNNRTVISFNTVPKQ